MLESMLLMDPFQLNIIICFYIFYILSESCADVMTLLESRQQVHVKLKNVYVRLNTAVTTR